jgi:hypothetical protein
MAEMMTKIRDLERNRGALRERNDIVVALSQRDRTKCIKS